MIVKSVKNFRSECLQIIMQIFAMDSLVFGFLGSYLLHLGSNWEKISYLQTIQKRQKMTQVLLRKRAGIYVYSPFDAIIILWGNVNCYCYLSKGYKLYLS